MKSKLLKYKGLLPRSVAMMLFAVLLSGCIAEHNDDTNADGKTIKFSPAVSPAQSKGVSRAAAGHPIESGYNIPAGSSFGAYAYSQLTTGGNIDPYTSLQNMRVTSNGTDFNYNPVAKWPIQSGAKLAFYGYYPWQDQSVSPASGDPVIGVTTGGQNAPSMTINYTTPSDPSKQVDLMYAYTDLKTGYDKVEMNFGHALTRIMFKARVKDYIDPVVITSITVTDVQTRGTLTVIDANTPAWSNLSTAADMSLTASNGLRTGYQLTSSLALAINPGGDMLVLPQSVQGLEVRVEATLGGTAFSEPFVFPLTGTPNWEMSRIVTYEITISGDGMKLDAKVDDWKENGINIIQDGQWWMTVDKDEFTFDINGGTGTVATETNYNITSQGYPAGISASVPAAYDSWLHVTASGSPGDLTRTFTITVDPLASAGRTGEVHITAGNFTKAIKVEQMGVRITATSVTPTSLVGYTAENVTFSITGTYPANTVQVRVWSATTVSVVAGPEYITTAQMESTGTQTLTVPANTTWDSRTLSMHYLDPSLNQYRTVTNGVISQPGYAVTTSATPWETKTAGTSTVTITGYRPLLPVRAVTESTTVLSTGTVAAANSGTGTATLAIPALPGTSDREITIQYLRDGVWTDITTFTQYNSIAPRFARSNIVWDGSKLIFAVTEADNAVIPANVQGMFFKWGSLVAVSPVGNTYASSQIFFSPNGTTNYSWLNIPYINDPNPPFNDSDINADDFATYNGGTGYNASTNKGDICRYITNQGWVQGRWRLPTAAEQNALITEATSVNDGTYINITGAPSGSNSYGNYANGYYQPASGRWLGIDAAGPSRGTAAIPGSGSVYIPAGGDRSNTNGSTDSAGNRGFIWSGSSGLDSANCLYITSGGGVYYGGTFRAAGFPVRCIRE